MDLVQNVFLSTMHTFVLYFCLDPLKSDGNHRVLILTVRVVLESTMKQEDVRCPEKRAWSSLENSEQIVTWPSSLPEEVIWALCNLEHAHDYVSLGTLSWAREGGAYWGLPNNSRITTVMKLCFLQIRYFFITVYNNNFQHHLGNHESALFYPATPTFSHLSLEYIFGCFP